jgi:hypothetical protein
MADVGSEEDIQVARPAPRGTDPRALAAHLTDVSGLLSANARYERQHRLVLLGLAAAEIPDATPDALGLTVSGSYTQAEVQSIATKLDDLIATVEALRAQLAALVGGAGQTLLSFRNDGGQNG